jgi:pimeloyl-ACP methyl ester carboxylesterase
MTELALGQDYWADKSLDQLKAEILARTGKRSPFVHAERSDVERALARLRSVEHDDWAARWSSIGDEYRQLAEAAEERSQAAEASTAYLKAWTYYSIARYPCPSSPPKREAYGRAREAYLAAARYFEHQFERLDLPFSGRPGEGDRIPVYLHRPRDVDRPAVVLMSGGIDQYKEEAHATAARYVAEGLAAVVYDMPGTGECPVVGSIDAERIYDPILEHLAERSDVDGSRVALVGRSFGGYWSTKAAHTHRRWLRAAVNWGGSVHHAFQPDWVIRSRSASSYLFELLETRAHAFGLRTAEEYIQAAPSLSLLTQGVLDQACAPLLSVNGKDDEQVPIDDLYILLEHGSPKEARVFPGGHLGPVPEVDPVVREWVKAKLA